MFVLVISVVVHCLQMFWVHGVEKRKRIIVRDKQEGLYSFPVECTLKFCLIDEDNCRQSIRRSMLLLI